MFLFNESSHNFFWWTRFISNTFFCNFRSGKCWSCIQYAMERSQNSKNDLDSEMEQIFDPYCQDRLSFRRHTNYIDISAGNKAMRKKKILDTYLPKTWVLIKNTTTSSIFNNEFDAIRNIYVTKNYIQDDLRPFAKNMKLQKSKDNYPNSTFDTWSGK